MFPASVRINHQEVLNWGGSEPETTGNMQRATEDDSKQTLRSSATEMKPETRVQNMPQVSHVHLQNLHKLTVCVRADVCVFCFLW